MDYGHFGGDIGQVQGFFHRCIAAADDGDLLLAIEKSVTGGAARDTLAHKSLFRIQPQVHGGGAGGDDQGIGGVLAAVADKETATAAIGRYGYDRR